MNESLDTVITTALLNAGWLRDLCPIVCAYARRTDLDTLWLLLHGRESRSSVYHLDNWISITWKSYGRDTFYTVIDTSEGTRFGHITLADLLPCEREPRWRGWLTDEDGWRLHVGNKLRACMAALDV